MNAVYGIFHPVNFSSALQHQHANTHADREQTVHIGIQYVLTPFHRHANGFSNTESRFLQYNKPVF